MDAAQPLFVALVQFVGSGDGGSAFDTAALRRVAGIDLGREPAPDDTTVCKFRLLLECHALGAKVLACVNKYLAEQGKRRATTVVAIIFAARFLTKNQAKAQDPEMKATKRGNQWHFREKAHIGVDSKTVSVR